MFVELQPRQFVAVRTLFGGFDYSLSIHATIEGNNPGRIFVICWTNQAPANEDRGT